MYQVWIRQSWVGNEQLIHSAHVNSLKLADPVVTLDVAAINSFTFNIYPNNPGYSQLRYLTTLIRVYDTQKKQDIFEGRVLLTNDSMDNSGLLYTSVTAEALEAFLHDSCPPFQEFTNKTREQILAALIADHNGIVEGYKQIQLGNIDFGADTPISYCYTDETADTYSNMSTLIMAGFEMRVRNVAGKLYLDVQKSFGAKGKQIIAINSNLLSAARSIDPTSVITVLKPLGPAQDITSSDESSSVDKGTPNMNISSVNNGSLYLRDQELINQFGVQVKAKSFDTATSPSNLKQLGTSFMSGQQFVTTQLQISVIDLFFVKGSQDDLWYGNTYRTRIGPMGVDQYWRISQQTINLLDPGQNTVTLGDRVLGQESYNENIANSTAAMKHYQNVIKRQNQKIIQLTVDVQKTQQSIVDSQKEFETIKEQVKELQDAGSGTVSYYTGAIIDVSEWQGTIDWPMVIKAGLALTVIRVQAGTSHEDLTYKTSIPNAISAGANYAVYAYFMAVSEADAVIEATNFYNRAQAVIGTNKQPRFWMIDLEEVSMSDMQSGMLAYVNQLNKLGVPDSKIVIYSGVPFMNENHITVTRNMLWIAAYGTNSGQVEEYYRPKVAFDLWQYTSVGKVPGISGNVDMSTEPSTRFKDSYLKK